MSDILERIVADKKIELSELKRQKSYGQIEKQAAESAPPRDFLSVFSTTRIAVIAEIKRASPSAGDILPGANPLEIAKDYAAAGVSAISVLTERKYFKGELTFLSIVKEAAPCPILRKDFIIDPYQIPETRSAGGDAFLLIADLLKELELRSMIELAQSFELTPLVEAHSEEDVHKSLATGARVIGVNARNLRTLEMDMKRFETLRKLVPHDVWVVAESGLKSPDEIGILRNLGCHAVLIGETLMKTSDRRGLARKFVEYVALR